MATLADLRRQIGLKMGQPWFRRFGKTAGTATGGSTTTLIDTVRLVQVDDFWRGDLLYHVGQQEVREINDFDQGTKTLTVLEPFGATCSGSSYEIWSQVSPIQVHDALNQALREAWPNFFESITEYIVVIEDDGNEYNLSNLLTYSPKFFATVASESWASSRTGTATGGAANQLADATSSQFTSDHVGWEVRIYAGTSAGDRRTISAVPDSDTITVSVNFTSTPDTTSKYRIVDVAEADREFIYETNWEVDFPEYPTRLRLGAHPYGGEGYLLRVRYEYEYPALGTEASTTNCPIAYLDLAARLHLYENLIASSPAVEISNWEKLYKVLHNRLTSYVDAHRFDHLLGTWTDMSQVTPNVAPDYPF